MPALRWRRSSSFATRKYRILGVLALPVISVIMLQAFFFGGEIRTLPPILNSYWLPMHVTTATFGYGAAAVSVCIALAFLLKDGAKPNTVRTYESTSRALLKFFGDKVIDQIKPVDVERFKEWRSKQSTKPRSEKKGRDRRKALNGNQPYSGSDRGSMFVPRVVTLSRHRVCTCRVVPTGGRVVWTGSPNLPSGSFSRR